MSRPLDGYGLHVDVPAGWDGRIRKPPARTATGETTHPVLHAASFALPGERGDFGGGAVELMTARDVFVALLEFGPESVGTPLFAHHPPHSISLGDLRSNALQRVIAGQRGGQWFFETSGRAFCLYVVLGGQARTADGMHEVNALLASLRVD